MGRLQKGLGSVVMGVGSVVGVVVVVVASAMMLAVVVPGPSSAASLPILMSYLILNCGF